MQVQILPADYVAAVRLKIRPGRAFTVVGLALVAVVLLALIFILVVSTDGKGTLSGLLMLVASGYLAAWYWILLPWRIKRLYIQQKSLHDPFTIEIEESGIRAKSKIGEGLTPWQHVYRWKEPSSLYVLFESDALMHIIPKRAFASPDEINAFRLVLLQHIGAANKPLKKRRAEELRVP